MDVRDPDFAGWVLGSMRSGLVAVDTAKRLAALNPGAQRILGCPEGAPAAALGRDAREALRRQPTVAHLLLEGLDGRERPSRAELALEPTGDRPACTIGFTLTAVRDPAGGVRGAAIFFRDLTPYERMDEQERLRERLAALGEMAAGLAHEIRNPLASMEVLAGLLRRRLEGRPEEQALVGELVGELRALASTVNASLEFVRPLAPARTTVDAVELVEESLALARSRVAFEGAIERDYAEALPFLLADAEQLRAVVTNLLVNALEAMRGDAGSEAPDGGHRLRIELRAESEERATWAVGPTGEGTDAPLARPARELVIAVSDSGPGVPAELRERIFYPFFTTKQRGSGIGLAHAQKVMASHGGAIDLESREGEGATFRLRLPLGVEAAPRALAWPGERRAS